MSCVAEIRAETISRLLASWATGINIAVIISDYHYKNITILKCQTLTCSSLFLDSKLHIFGSWTAWKQMKILQNVCSVELYLRQFYCLPHVMEVIKCVCLVTVFSPVARRWLWTSWAWGCCRLAARWQTSWQRASPVRDDGHIHHFSVLWHFLWNCWHVNVCFCPCSCGGHQQATRASSQPGGHLPDYTHREGKQRLLKYVLKWSLFHLIKAVILFM